jgi:hypothetical protein
MDDDPIRRPPLARRYVHGWGLRYGHIDEPSGDSERAGAPPKTYSDCVRWERLGLPAVSSRRSVGVFEMSVKMDRTVEAPILVPALAIPLDPPR